MEIDILNKTAEEVQDIFMDSANLFQIELLTDEEEVTRIRTGWTVYGGVNLNGDTKTVVLTKEINPTEERLVSAEANVLKANTEALEVRFIAEKTAGDLDTAITELTLIVAGGGANV